MTFSSSKTRHFGHVEGCDVGEWRRTLTEFCEMGVHDNVRQGIGGGRFVGCPSVVLKCVYEDDEDSGREFYFTGTGGKYKRHQVADQTMTHYKHLGILRSMHLNQPIRVIRGCNYRSLYAPRYGYRYDGLYNVVEAKTLVGKSGYLICRFKFVRIEDRELLL